MLFVIISTFVNHLINLFFINMKFWSLFKKTVFWSCFKFLWGLVSQSILGVKMDKFNITLYVYRVTQGSDNSPYVGINFRRAALNVLKWIKTPNKSYREDESRNMLNQRIIPSGHVNSFLFETGFQYHVFVSQTGKSNTPPKGRAL